MTDTVKKSIKKAAEIIMYLIIGGLISAGVLNVDKLKDLISHNEINQVETSANMYAEETVTSVEIAEPEVSAEK